MGQRTGLVVAGAGARGAYEAGALSVLVPELAAGGGLPSVLVGTSAGALNVVGLAGALDAGLQPALDGLAELWGAVRLGEVVDVPGTLVGGLRYAAQLAGLPVRVPSLLDTTPQRATLEALVDWDRLHANVADGPVDAVAVATTRVDTGATVVFVEKKPSVPLPPPDADRNLTYVETQLTVEHVLASSAVPAAFRPVEVTTPAAWSGWYVDGGLRLNAPLKPALDLGCDLLGVVATQPSSYRSSPVADPSPAAPSPVTAFPVAPSPVTPDVPTVAALALRSLLADRMVEDLRLLTAVNGLVASGAQTDRYREVGYRFAGPAAAQADDLSRLAAEVYRREYGGLKGLRNPALAVLDRLIGGAAPEHGELLSFLFFDAAFTREAARLGARHARGAGALTVPLRRG